MSVIRLSPEGMTEGVPYAHVAVATGSRQVHVAGQIARTRDGSPVAPGDLTGQVAQSLRNVELGLRGAGATFDDVVRLTFYIADWAPEKLEAFRAGVREGGVSFPMPPTALIGVQSLVQPDVLVEVEATAVLD